MHTDGPTGETEAHTGGGGWHPRRRIHLDWFLLLGAVLAAYAAGGLALVVMCW
ncbi:MAG: hypothetical protein IRZ07_03905 [Microbispora sp.]|nr:hypothetical protein [Microbispora sp.]